MHHAVGRGNVDLTIRETVEASLREGMVLGVERDDGGTVQSRRHGVVVLRDVMLHELLHDGGAVAAHQALVVGIADGAVDRRPDRIEAGAVEGFRELALLGKGSKLRQLLVAADILPQRLVGTWARIGRHRVVVVIVSAAGDCGTAAAQQTSDEIILHILGNHNIQFSIINSQLFSTSPRSWSDC